MRFSKFRALIALLLALAALFSLCSCELWELVDIDSIFSDADGNTPEYAADLDSIPEYSGAAYVIINGDIPYFTEDEITDESYEFYSPLDSLGRCGVTIASVGQDIMPTEERGSIGSVKPTGWHTVKYDIVDGKYLYNRCHLIGFQLTGENANTKNLITGTRYLNIEGMLPFEDMIADYVKESGNHVMYRVTPIFVGSELVARGVLMEAYSVEDSGAGITFCVYAYNVQPGIYIDYATGESCLAEDSDSLTGADNADSGSEDDSQNTGGDADGEIVDDTQLSEDSATYVLNTSTHKFHTQSCRYAETMSESNKLVYTGSRLDVVEMGYSPCSTCNP